jgi:DNA repair protein RadC
MNTTKQPERNLWDARGWSSGEIVVLKVCDSKGPKIGSARAVADYFQDDARAIREWFRVLYVNSTNEIILNKLEFVGTVDSSPVYPREIIVTALQCGASSIILAHNHPSGDPAPSYADKDITKSIIFAATTLQIKVLDHVIIGASKAGEKAPYFSFAEHGDLESYVTQALSYSRLT